LKLPEHFIKTVSSTFDGGREWLRQLPETIAACERLWSLRVGEPFDLSYNFVAPAVRADGGEVVLKAGVPNPELWTEVAALRHYGGRGAVGLVAVSEELGAFLMERARPGLPLKDFADDDQATEIAAGVMKALWHPAPEGHNFPTVETWAQGLGRLRETFGGGTGPYPRALVEKAEAIFAEMLVSQGEAVLLHGDLHHWNILSSGASGWLVIDPKGVVGEREYEAGSLLRNPYNRIQEWPDLAVRTQRRIDILAEILGFDKQRLAAWNFAQAVLSNWWGYEDLGEVWEEWIGVAEVFGRLVS